MQIFLITLLIYSLGFSLESQGWVLAAGQGESRVWVGWGIFPCRGSAVPEHLHCPLVASAPEPLATGSAVPCCPPVLPGDSRPPGGTTVLNPSPLSSLVLIQQPLLQGRVSPNPQA